MTPEERAWSVVKQKLCNISVCTFPNGCGCVDAISFAIREAEEAARQKEREAIADLIKEHGERQGFDTLCFSDAIRSTAIRQRGET